MFANTKNPNCPNCNKSGLAILPVRYAVVPLEANASLPEPLGNKVTSVKLKHYKYALRTLRQGFVYLFYEKHARGSNIKWEIYSVSPAGTLWKQYSPDAIQSVATEPACSVTGHNIPASVITIEKPERCGKVWIAFSEHAWSENTFEAFKSDVKLRNERMQTLAPSMWIKDKGYQHGLEGTQANVEKVIEYQDGSNIVAVTCSPIIDISEADGKHHSHVLKKQATRYPLHLRRGQSSRVAEAMKAIGARADGGHHPPIILALWDAVGITHELNGFKTDAAGWVEKYNQERELEIAALNALEGIKKLLEDGAVQYETKLQQRATNNFNQVGSTLGRRAAAAKLPEPKRTQEIEVCNILDDWARQKMAAKMDYPLRLDMANMLSEPRRSSEIAKVKSDADKFFAVRDANAKKRSNEAKAAAWPKYGSKIDEKAYSGFKYKYDTFLAEASALIDDRTEDLIAWLESPSLIAAFTEFHTDDIRDGAEFEKQVGEAIYGINGTAKGGAKIDEWVREMKASKANLLWRAVALNQKQAMDALDATLEEAARHQADRTLASTLNWVNYTAKSLKAFADTYKKLVSVQNANTPALSAAGSKAFGVKLKPVNMRGLDNIGITLGDKVFKAFRVSGLADYASEKIIQHIFTVRAFVSEEDSVNLIEVQAKSDELSRRQRLKRLGITRNFMAADTPAMRTAQSESLGRAWQEFTEKQSGANAVKDARLAVVVMLIEGVSFNKLIVDCAIRNDAKSWWSLAASGLTITSALFDVASVPAKGLFGAESWSYQRLKLAGGVLSSAASAVTALLDIRDAMKFYGKGNWSLMGAYFLKGTVGFLNAGLTAATTFTYAVPLIARLTGHRGLITAAGVISARAAAILGIRILFMAAGAWLTVAAFGIQVFIWKISDNALEEWCSLCAFGSNRTSRDGYRAVKAQSVALENALCEIGVAG